MEMYPQNFTQERYNEWCNKRSFLYIIQENRWVEKSSLSEERVSPACGYVKNEMTNKYEVVVAGGYCGSSEYLSTTEIYTVDDDTWRAGAGLITPLYSNFLYVMG